MVVKSGFRGKTFGAILDLNKGVGLGFDVLRLGLALMVLVIHGSGVTNHSGTTAWIIRLLHSLNIFSDAAAAVRPTELAAPALAPTHLADPTRMGLAPPTGPVIRAVIPMFFALSGFLVAGSAMRTTSLLKFLGLRALRLLPALFVEVTLSAIILGAIFTTLPLGEYYSHPEFAAYFLNILGIVHFTLPGVFGNIPSTAVNANLWTIPFELECYALMSIFIIFGLLKRRGLFTILFAISTVGLTACSILYGFMAPVDIFPGRALIYCFATGIIFYVWRDKIVYRPAIMVACIVVSYILLMLPMTVFLAPLPLTYVMVYLGLMPMPQFRLVKSGDYSYGIYLYGFPITQALVSILGPNTFPFPVMMALAVLASCLFAAFSWHCVEKHCLKLKRYLSTSSAKITGELHPGASELGVKPMRSKL